MTSIWKLISFQIAKGFPANANSQTACYNHIKRLKLHQQCDNLATLGTKPQMHTCLASWGIEKKSGIGREYGEYLHIKILSNSLIHFSSGGHDGACLLKMEQSEWMEQSRKPRHLSQSLAVEAVSSRNHK
nr:hypothetical protein Iba_chr06cCG15770 [Ipomoea batatas]